MKTEIIALEIEVRQYKLEDNQFVFNDTMLHALQSGLSAIYAEVFIWSFNRHLIVLAVGDQPQFLLQAFNHHNQHYKKIKILNHDKALLAVSNVVNGKSWAECNQLDKLNSIQYGIKLSGELESLGSILSPIVMECVTNLANHSVVIGSRNSWSVGKSEERKADKVSIGLKDSFYRFCIN